MKNIYILLLSILVLAMQLTYFFISDGPFIEEGVPASVQLSGGNDDRVALAFGTLFFTIPVLYALIALPFRFKTKDIISIVMYFVSFIAWGFFAVAVNFDTPLMKSFSYGDLYIMPYILAPLFPVAFILYRVWLTRRSSMDAQKTRAS